MNWTNTRNEGGVWKLHDEVSSAAFESTEALWSAFLEAGDLDMVRSTEKALRLMASHGDHTGAMKLLEGIYALTELTPTKDFPAAQVRGCGLGGLVCSGGRGAVVCCRRQRCPGAAGHRPNHCGEAGVRHAAVSDGKCGGRLCRRRILCGLHGSEPCQNRDGYSLTAEIYDYDRYELEDIRGLKEGDQIQVCRKPVTVESIRRDNGTVIINGGIESGGVELIEDDGLYRTCAMDDHPIYYDLGTITLPLSTDCTFEDHADLEQEPDGLVHEYEDVPAAIQASETPFNCYNTVITVRQEQVVQIIRYWIP